MNKDYYILKKNYGEKFAKLCRELFPTIIEVEGLLPKIILSKFATNHFLYDDIVKNYSVEIFKDYIYSFIDVEKDKIQINKSVKELLSEAGYNFYECKKEKDIQFFRKYYKKDEELCTFNGGRLNSCYVYWAVKKNVNEIKREDFKKPSREDKYGTSVISIQFSKNGHTLSIKNRYNHHVNNPDATFSNNLDNIVPGLTNAFEREYGLRINQNEYTNIFLPNYVLADDGKYYKYNYEMNNIYYCIDNIIIDNGIVHSLDKSRYLLIDYFIIDFKEKTIKLYDNCENNINCFSRDFFFDCKDSFPDSFENIEKIEIIKNKKGKNIIIKSPNKEEAIIKTNNTNIIIGIDDKNIEVIKDNYLHLNTNITELKLPKVKKIEDWFMTNNKRIKEIYLPSVIEIGNYFNSSNEKIEEINMPNLEIVGDYFLFHSTKLTNINLPKLKKTGKGFLSERTKHKTK